MMKFIKTFASRFLSPELKASLQQVYVELVIARHHRAGLRFIRKRSLSRPSRLNLGSGNHRRQGYLNVDMFPGGDVTIDIRQALPFDSNCCEFILSEHCLEHIDYPDGIAKLLRECLRVLTPGGTLHFSVPDTEWPLTDYARGPDASYFRACTENPWWHAAYCKTRIEHINYHFRQNGEHRFAYDEETARKVLGHVGFVDVRRESFDPSIDSKHREVGSLFISARKPAS